MPTGGQIRTISGGTAATRIDDLAPVSPVATVPGGMICRVSPTKISEVTAAMNDPNIEQIAYNVTPRQLNPSPGIYNPDPYGIHAAIGAVGKAVCPIVIPLTSDGLGLPDHFVATAGAEVMTTDGKRLPRPNDPRYCEYMGQLAATIGLLWRDDRTVGMVRACGFSVDTNEPAGYGNGKTSGWAALRPQLVQAVAVPVGSPPIPGIMFDGDSPILDGSDDDGFTRPYLDIVGVWIATLGLKAAATIKFSGGSEDGFRAALRATLAENRVLALNTGANDQPDHADAFAYAAAAPFGWGGMTLEDPGRSSGLTGLALREYVANVCVPAGGPPIYSWQAEQRFYSEYPSAAATIRERLCR